MSGKSGQRAAGPNRLYLECRHQPEPFKFLGDLTIYYPCTLEKGHEGDCYCEYDTFST